MRTLLTTLLFLAGCAALPQPGTPAAKNACEQLRATGAYIERYYPWDPDDWARESMILQFAEYRAELGCTDVPLPCGDRYYPGETP